MKKKSWVIFCVSVVLVLISAVVYAGQQLDLGSTSLEFPPSNGDLMVYNRTTDKWENGATVQTLTVAAGLVLPSGETPLPATSGALFYDTNAGGAKGSLVMYNNESAWQTIKDFN